MIVEASGSKSLQERVARLHELVAARDDVVSRELGVQLEALSRVLGAGTEDPSDAEAALAEVEAAMEDTMETAAVCTESKAELPPTDQTIERPAVELSVGTTELQSMDVVAAMSAPEPPAPPSGPSADVFDGDHANVPEDEHHPWKDVSLGDPGELGAVASATLEALRRPGEPATSDVLLDANPSDEQGAPETAEEPEDALAAARREAEHLKSALGAGTGDLDPAGEVEPLEQLARTELPMRPSSAAVAILPKRIAYDAMAAPLKVDEDGTLVCLVPEEYEPSRVRKMALQLERRVTVYEVEHEQVLDALGAAYGPPTGVDQDALLLSISDESKVAHPSLVSRMGSWLKGPWVTR